MSRIGWLFLGLVTLTAVLGLYMSSDPDQAGRLDEMRRGATLTGDMREMVILLLVVVVGGFIGYLAMSRR